MIKKLKIFVKVFFICCICVNKSFAESIADLENQLSDIREEISNLSSVPTNQGVMAVISQGGKAVPGLIIANNGNTVTYLEINGFGGAAQTKTGILIGENNLKDIAERQAVQLATEAAAQQVRSQTAIDVALSELNKATDFMQESYKKGDFNGAIAALSIIDLTINDVVKNIPSTYKSEVVSEAKKFSEAEMSKINNITQNITKNNDKVYEELKSNISLVTEKGLNINEITEKIVTSGLNVPKMQNYFTRESNNSLKANLTDTAKYSSIIGSNPEQIQTALKQVEALKSGDPKQLRAAELEKYGRIAGLTQVEIQKGVQAVLSGNINEEKQITLSIMEKMKNNPDYVVTLTNNQIDKYMEEQLALEKAAYTILNSNINFGKGTNQNEVKNLSNEIEAILAGKVDQAKIQQIKNDIQYTTYTLSNKNKVASNLIAQVNGKEYVDAINKISSAGSITEQAAIVEATLSGNLDSLNEISRNSTQVASTMSAQQLSQLSNIFEQTIAKDAQFAVDTAKQIEIQNAFQKSLKNDYELAKSQYFDTLRDQNWAEAQKAYEKMNKAQLASVTQYSFEEIPQDFKTEFSNIEAKSISAAEAAKASLDALSNAESAKNSAEQSAQIAADQAKQSAVAESNKQATAAAAQAATQAAQEAATKAAETATSEASQAAKDAAQAAAQQAQAAAAQAQAAAQQAAQEAAQQAAQAAAAQAQAAAQQAAQEAAQAAVETAKAAASEAAKAASEAAASQVAAVVETVTKEQAADFRLEVEKLGQIAAEAQRDFLFNMNAETLARSQEANAAWAEAVNQSYDLERRSGPLSVVDIQNARDRAASQEGQ